MGVLRNTINVIFNKNAVEDVLRFIIETGRERHAIMDEQQFVSAYLQVSPGHTGDQALSAYQIMETTWICGRNDAGLMFCNQKNLFNILLHFSGKALTLENDQPVCRFEHLLKWHEVSSIIGEDILATAHLASRDIICRESRKDFSWPIILGHNSTELNEMYQKPMADIHCHLKGSGMVAELNWLSLMNDITERKSQFDEKSLEKHKALRTVQSNKKGQIPLYNKVIIAAAIRLHLFHMAYDLYPINEKDKKLDNIKGILRNYDNIYLMYGYLNRLNSEIRTAKLLYGNFLTTHSNNKVCIDYAIPNEIEHQVVNNIDNCNSYCCGERRLMYLILKKIYRGEDKGYQLSNLFYAYLLIKNDFRQELIQTNPILGFMNFSEYDQRKSLFLKKNSIYKDLLPRSAVLNFIENHPNRYIEVRIAPENNINEYIRTIKEFDNDIVQSTNPLKRLSPNNEIETKELKSKYDYVVHFIKKQDSILNESSLQHPRNWNVRNNIKQQSIALSGFMDTNPMLAQKIVGIDAANSELFCRPEVFAQVFRYLRQKYLKLNYGQVKQSLGITYHVGEDFYDIIDGLRAIREAMMFMEMREGDRIGHGLVLGTNVNQYYSRRSYQIPMPKQCILDNTAFLLIEGAHIPGFESVRQNIENVYEKYFRIIFGSKIKEISRPYTYYQSWLLRGDNPECYQTNERFYLNSSVSDWNKCNYVWNDLQAEARENEEARKLVHLYHYNYSVKYNGQSFDQINYPKELLSLIEQLQNQILSEVEKRRLSIECNPSSNYKIGEFYRFDEHPISKFYNNKLFTDKKDHQICVSINTDDMGIFSTSLEREFALMAAAYKKKYEHNDKDSPSPRAINDWLNQIRGMAFEMKFRKDGKLY